MNISITSIEFAIFLGLSLAIAIWYFVGHKRNLRLIEKISKNIERALKPADKEYTWLGGVLGFTGNFEVNQFEKVTASVFMLPRQSVLYYPFSYLTTGFDRLEVLFYLKEKVWNEIHLVRKLVPHYWMPKIYNAESLKARDIEVNKKPFVVMYRKKSKEIDKIIKLAERLEPYHLMHIAITPQKSIFYIKLKVRPSDMDSTGKALHECMAFFRAHSDLKL